MRKYPLFGKLIRAYSLFNFIMIKENRNMKQLQITITESKMNDYFTYLKEQERSYQTIQKYERDLRILLQFLKTSTLNKEKLILWKEHLVEQYSPATVNSMLTSVNGFLSFHGYQQCRVKPLKIQKMLFYEEDKELTKEEYVRLIHTALSEDKLQIALILQTLCATGIRISELQFITVDCVKNGRTIVSCKGKHRIVFLPKKLKYLLENYAKEHNKTYGPIFTSKRGNPLDRSNIWRSMKNLCAHANVDPKKVYPHNLRHLFARTYYDAEKDISRLADILGHSSVSTTKIYTMERGSVHAKQIDNLDLVVSTT